MKAIIMAGGFGTRLRPLTINMPKPMVPIGNLPMMEHVVNLCRENGFDEIMTLLFFQHEIITDYFKDGRKFGVKMNYMLPDQDYGTAGAVRAASDFCDETTLIISGDVLTDFNLTEAVDFHKANNGDASIVLTRLENPLAYGIVITDKNNRITRFMEKPSWGEMFSDTINTGIYILEPDTVKLIPPKTNFDFSQNLFPIMLQKEMNLLGKISQGYWRDIGNIDEYTHAQQDILDGDVTIYQTDERTEQGDTVVYQGKNVDIADKVTFTGTVFLGDGSHIGRGAIIGNSIIGAKVVIGAEAKISDTTIWSDTNIGDLTSISSSIITNRVQIGRESSILDRAVISDDCKIGAGASIRANCKIWPGKIVDEGAVVSSSIVWGEKWNRELFTDSKVSGLGLTEITPEMAVKLGAAFGASLGRNQRIVASRDASDATRLLKRSIMCGLMATGVDVDDLEILPSPVLRHALKNGNYGAGVYLRHNPANYNMVDIIFLDASGLDLPTAKAKKVERSFANEDFPRASMAETGHLELQEGLFKNYKAEFLRSINRDKVKHKDFRIVIDYSYGSAGQFFPEITSALGIDAISLNAFPNPSRASEHSRSSDEKIGQLSTIVTALSADLGVMINPAAEKMTVIDRTGTAIGSQMLLLMITDLYLKNHNARRIAVPVAASMGVEKIAERYDVEVIRVRNDHLAMMDAHIRQGADFVGGTLGGFIFPGFQIGADAMFATAHLLEMMASSELNLSDMREEHSGYVRRTVSVPCPWGKKGQVMRTLISETDNKNRQLIDGVRVFEDGGTVLVVPDRLTAAFTVFAESESEDALKVLIDQYTELVKESQK
ncbi:MAG: NTP transferase domain-containing protein [candidate division Zixibacteria bacterium]|nr:NTP transferase domain-containing protein [candidate division Zixibacteria bacterium]